MAKIITHSPTAFSQYRQRLSLSRELIAKKTSIPVAKIEKGEHESNVFTFKQIQKLAGCLFVPDFYLLSDTVWSNPIPSTIDHRNRCDIDDENTHYQSQKALHELVDSRANLIYTYDSLDVSAQAFDLALTGDDAVHDSLLIRQWLGVDNAKFTIQNNDDYYRAWRTLIEKKDVLVIELSATKIGSEGMALYYDILPVIAILSSGQAPTRRLFTMVHELVHLGLRQSAIDGNILQDNHKIEQYCNQVAGHVLLPKAIVDKLYNHALSLDENITKIRQAVKVSKQAIAIQLKLLGYINQTQMNAYFDVLQEAKSTNTGYGVTKKTKVHNRFGRVYLQQIISAVWQDAISMNTAMKMLHLNDVQDFSYLEQKVFS